MHVSHAGKRPLRSPPFGSLESPFLDEELFAAPGDDECRGARPPAPEAKSSESLESFEAPFAYEEHGVISGENRVRVQNTTGVPWRWICKIRVEDSRRRLIGQGTGVLVSDRHVLTAAHVVYAAYKNMRQHTITVIPALNDLDEPFGSYAVSTKPKIRREYDPTASGSLNWDYALLRLSTPIGTKEFSSLKGGALCYWGSPQPCGANTVFARLEPRTLNGQATYTAGYPGGKGAGRQLWCASGILHSADERRRTMGTTADTTQGQSGSPVWIIDNKRFCLVGIAVGAGRSSNTLVRVTRELIRQIRAWITEDGETASMVETKEALEPPVQLQSDYETEGYPPPPRERSSRSFAREYPLFEHNIGNGVAPWQATVDPLPSPPTVAFHVNDKRMVDAFAPVLTSPVRHLCAALVDLTGNPLAPPYVGMNDEEMVFAGSMVKAVTMYVAFALRARVQAFVDAAAANGVPVVAPGIIAEIEKAWKPKVQGLFPSRPTTSYGNRMDMTFPKLDRIFTFSAGGKVDFTGAAAALTDAQLDRAGEFGIPRGGFHDWMRLMLRWSNNTAASYCTLALGYFYLNGALEQAGFFDSATENGLWLSADYARHDWVSTEAEKKANAAGKLLSPRWATAQRRSRSNVTATAAQAARFMTLLAQGRLVEADANHPDPNGEMRTMMQAAVRCVPRGSCGIGSYVKDALSGVRPRRPFTGIAAKKGFGDDSFSHECAIVERTVSGKDLRYVVVGLGSAPSRARRDLSSLFVRLDDVIVARNA